MHQLLEATPTMASKLLDIELQIPIFMLSYRRPIQNHSPYSYFSLDQNNQERPWTHIKS